MKKNKTKISWETIIAMILFAGSVIAMLIVAFAPLCLTWTGSIFLLTMITIAGYTFNYLAERYEKIK